MTPELFSLLVFSGFILGGARVLMLLVPMSELTITLFKDVAHLYMGAAAIIGYIHRGDMRFMFWLLCLIELICAAIPRVI